MAKRFVFLISVILACCCCLAIHGAIYAEDLNFKIFDPKNYIEKLQSPVDIAQLNRVKRDVPNAKNKTQPSIKTTELQNDNHQQAVISWSGKPDSLVIIPLFVKSTY